MENEKLAPGWPVAPGDELFSSNSRRPCPGHLYVVNEDENGDSFLVFLCVASSYQSELPRPAGSRSGATTAWRVTTRPARREHFSRLRSPDRLIVREAFSSCLSAEKRAFATARCSREPLNGWRSVGVLTSDVSRPSAGTGLARLFSDAADHARESVRGLWIASDHAR